MAISQYPNIGTYVTAEMHKKFQYLAFKKDTSMAKLLYGMIVFAIKDITMDEVDKAKGKDKDESKTDS